MWRTSRIGERAVLLLLELLLVWIVLLPLATVLVLYVLAPRSADRVTSAS